MSSDDSIEINSSSSVSSSDNNKYENIKSYVRWRPSLKSDLNWITTETTADKLYSIQDENKSIIISTVNSQQKKTEISFNFDYIFNEDITQEMLFQHIAWPNINALFKGYNCTIFCYGQTGAGKTHTMIGPINEMHKSYSSYQGLLPRILNYINTHLPELKEWAIGETQEITSFQIEFNCSCLELYREKFIDLLSPNITTNNTNTDPNNSYDKNTISEKETISSITDLPQTKADKLTIREDARKGMFIDGATRIPINNGNIQSTYEKILLGLKYRHVAGTEMNIESSRSHLLFTLFIDVNYTLPSGNNVTKFSRLHLIDLAGSERHNSCIGVPNIRWKEIGMINKSLSTLGNVINAWNENINEGKNKYVPFRDSKLTFFLKDSLGGNSKTTIIGNITLIPSQLNESLNTLNFLKRAKEIKNRAIVNEDISQKVISLQNEIRRWKELLSKDKTVSSKGMSVKCWPVHKLSNRNSTMNMPRMIKRSASIESISGANTNCKNQIPIKHGSIIDVENQSITLNRNDFWSFTNQINNYLEHEEKVNELLSKYNNHHSNSLKQFLEQKSKYEEIVKNSVSTLNNAERAWTKITDDNNINDMINVLNQKTTSHLSKDDTEKLTAIAEGITLLRDISKEYNITDYEKMKTEYESMKSELAAYKNLCEFYTENEYQESKINQNDIKDMNFTMEMFIQSNKIWKDFLKTNWMKGDIGEEIVFVNKLEYEKLRLQVEELTDKEMNYEKIIEDWQNDNCFISGDYINVNNSVDFQESSMNNEIARYKEKNENIGAELEKIKEWLKESSETNWIMNAEMWVWKNDKSEVDEMILKRDKEIGENTKKMREWKKSVGDYNDEVVGICNDIEHMIKRNEEIMKISYDGIINDIEGIIAEVKKSEGVKAIATIDRIYLFTIPAKQRPPLISSSIYELMLTRTDKGKSNAINKIITFTINPTRSSELRRVLSLVPLFNHLTNHEQDQRIDLSQLANYIETLQRDHITKQDEVDKIATELNIKHGRIQWLNDTWEKRNNEINTLKSQLNTSLNQGVKLNNDLEETRSQWKNSKNEWLYLQQIVQQLKNNEIIQNKIMEVLERDIADKCNKINQIGEEYRLAQEENLSWKEHKTWSNDTIKELEKNIDDKMNSISYWENLQGERNKEIKDLTKDNEIKEKTLREYEQDIIDKSNEIASFKQELATIYEEIASWKQDKSDKDKIIDQLKQNTINKDQEILLFKERNKNINEEINNFKNEKEMNNKKIEQYKQIICSKDKEISALVQKEVKRKDEISSLKHDKDIISSKLANLEHDISNKTQQISILKMEKLTINNEILSLNKESSIKDKTITELQRLIKNKTEEISLWEKSQLSNNKEIKSLQKCLNSQNQQISDFKLQETQYTEEISSIANENTKWNDKLKEVYSLQMNNKIRASDYKTSTYSFDYISNTNNWISAYNARITHWFGNSFYHPDFWDNNVFMDNSTFFTDIRISKKAKKISSLNLEKHRLIKDITLLKLEKKDYNKYSSLLEQIREENQRLRIELIKWKGSSDTIMNDVNTWKASGVYSYSNCPSVKSFRSSSQKNIFQSNVNNTDMGSIFNNNNNSNNSNISLWNGASLNYNFSK